MSDLKELLSIVPQAPDFRIGWQDIEKTVMQDYATAMKETRQNPVYHAEGDVWTHTKMVCECLVKYAQFRALADRQRQELFLAALFHDVGKIFTTRLENGELTSPNHSAVGANIVRKKLWCDYGVCGTKNLQNFRETVCQLIRYHMMPAHLPDADDPEQRMIRNAANGELAPDYSLKLLFALSKADSEGRISENSQGADMLSLIEDMAKESECLDKPKRFLSDFTEQAYLSGRNVSPETELYNDTACEVIMMCGLPGREWGGRQVRPHQREDGPGDQHTGDQQEVVRIARERAKLLLRQKKSFIWNATSITPDVRSRLISLFTGYNAYVKIIFLETDYRENLRRNKNRKDTVPQAAIERMLAKLTPPERYEAHEVRWVCV